MAGPTAAAYEPKMDKKAKGEKLDAPKTSEALEAVKALVKAANSLIEAYKKIEEKVQDGKKSEKQKAGESDRDWQERNARAQRALDEAFAGIKQAFGNFFAKKKALNKETFGECVSVLDEIANETFTEAKKELKDKEAGKIVREVAREAERNSERLQHLKTPLKREQVLKTSLGIAIASEIEKGTAPDQIAGVMKKQVRDLAEYLGKPDLATQVELTKLIGDLLEPGGAQQVDSLQEFREKLEQVWGVTRALESYDKIGQIVYGLMDNASNPGELRQHVTNFKDGLNEFVSELESHPDPAGAHPDALHKLHEIKSGRGTGDTTHLATFVSELRDEFKERLDVEQKRSPGADADKLAIEVLEELKDEFFTLLKDPRILEYLDPKFSGFGIAPDPGALADLLEEFPLLSPTTSNEGLFVLLQQHYAAISAEHTHGATGTSTHEQITTYLQEELNDIYESDLVWDVFHSIISESSEAYHQISIESAMDQGTQQGLSENDLMLLCEKLLPLEGGTFVFMTTVGRFHDADIKYLQALATKDEEQIKDATAERKTAREELEEAFKEFVKTRESLSEEEYEKFGEIWDEQYDKIWFGAESKLKNTSDQELVKKLFTKENMSRSGKENHADQQKAYKQQLTKHIAENYKQGGFLNGAFRVAEWFLSLLKDFTNNVMRGAWGDEERIQTDTETMRDHLAQIARNTANGGGQGADNSAHQAQAEHEKRQREAAARQQALAGNASMANR